MTKISRQSAPFAAALTGAAFCLTGTIGEAAIKTGDIIDSNGRIAFTSLYNFKAFSSKAQWDLMTNSGGLYLVASTADMGLERNVAGQAYTRAAGVEIQTSWNFRFAAAIPVNADDTYMIARFLDSGERRYGWIHVESTTATRIIVDKWGYEDSAGTLRTLSESCKIGTLPLADGRTRLSWTNGNEQGVASYILQRQDSDGSWHETDSQQPGTGAYTHTITGAAPARVVLEKLDGTQRILSQ
jgi:hypothetical protein